MNSAALAIMSTISGSLHLVDTWETKHINLCLFVEVLILTPLQSTTMVYNYYKRVYLLEPFDLFKCHGMRIYNWQHHMHSVYLLSGYIL